jgi:hypothetical protein
MPIGGLEGHLQRIGVQMAKSAGAASIGNTKGRNMNGGRTNRRRQRRTLPFQVQVRVPSGRTQNTLHRNFLFPGTLLCRATFLKDVICMYSI